MVRAETDAFIFCALLWSYWEVAILRELYSTMRRFTVHFDEQLVERVFPLVVAAELARAAACPADGVDLVDEDDARCILARLAEQVPDARRPDAHEHLQELGARDAQERHLRLARNRFGQQRLARPRRAGQNGTLGGGVGTKWNILVDLQSTTPRKNVTWRACVRLSVNRVGIAAWCLRRE